eukprot:gnl/MRDRNA2_/MRDRNA2_62086_c0_seq1.p1 gnl/MRDRNA2_/MRDRNA2_62086_c0~~gnl/MRDRNA2_/MRDRNA2_62086_c0_seq1.p1  ORF type:complete len:288 (-),score=48.72 gnl/MRDRNA2_/MRDRNA2_62086_c0_seq1:87-950(-)
MASNVLVWPLLISAALAATCGSSLGWCPSQVGTRDTSNVTALLIDALGTMNAAINAVFSTHAVSKDGSDSGDINSRVMSPKPVTQVADAGSLSVIYIDTNNLARKYIEIQDAVKRQGAARATLLYYDVGGAGYVSLRGNATISSTEEAKKEWWDGWDAFYPQKENTSFYSIIRFEPNWLEISAGTAVQSGRADWLPVSLERVAGVWEVIVPAVPPAPSPPAPPPASPWRCSICSHVYDPQKDGAGLPFEQLPDTFKCPICGALKSAFKKVTLEDGSEQWVHEDAEFI